MNISQSKDTAKVPAQPNDVVILKVSCVNGAYLERPYSFTLEFPETSSLANLAAAILKAVDFDFDHLIEFFAGRHSRNRKLVIGDTEDFDDNPFDAYSEITLASVYPLPKSCKLYMHFDFGDDWIFEIRKLRQRPIANPGQKYPRLVNSDGKKPLQYGDHGEEW